MMCTRNFIVLIQSVNISGNIICENSSDRTIFLLNILKFLQNQELANYKIIFKKTFFTLIGKRKSNGLLKLQSKYKHRYIDCVKCKRLYSKTYRSLYEFDNIYEAFLRKRLLVYLYRHYDDNNNNTNNSNVDDDGTKPNCVRILTSSQLKCLLFHQEGRNDIFPNHSRTTSRNRSFIENI